MYETSSLRDRVNAVLVQLESIGVDRSRQCYGEQMKSSRAVLWSALERAGSTPEVADRCVTAVATKSLKSMKSLSKVVRHFEGLVGGEDAGFPLRCALAGVLAYFVRTEDVVRDDLPGYYGFCDDAIILRAGGLAYHQSVEDDAASVHKHQVDIGILSSGLAEDQVQRCEAKIRGVKSIFDVLRGLPGPTVKEVFQEILARPDEARLPEPTGAVNVDFPGLYTIGRPQVKTGVKTDGVLHLAVCSFPGGIEFHLAASGEGYWRETS